MTVSYILLSIISVILYIIYLIINRKFNYWKKKKVPFAKPSPFVGNYGEYIFLRKSNGKVTQELCRQFPDEPYFGTFYGTEPALVVQDPVIIKHVVIKDYVYFTGRQIMDHSHKEELTRNIFFSGGDNWKIPRKNLTPLFTSAKMKNMFYLIQKCNKTFEDMLDREVGMSKVLEAGDLTTRYSMDCICSCVFGIESNTMGKDHEKNDFKIIGAAIMDSSNSRGLKNIARVMWPDIFYGLGFRNFPLALTDFFSQLLKEVFKRREYQPSQRHDLVDEVLNWNKMEYLSGDSVDNFKTDVNKKVRIKVNENLMAAQCVLFFAAGFDTSASALCFTLYEFAKNLEAQDLAFREVDEYLRKQEGKLDYNCTTELPYLNACLSETLRLYPTFGLLPREVSHNYTFSTGLSVEKGLRIHIPVYHIHRDPKNFVDPDDYKPERFMPDRVHEIKPYTYFPFGEGARVCIGKRLAKMQVLAGLVTFLNKYRVETTEDTPLKVDFDPRAITVKATCDIKLRFIKREMSK